MASWLRSRLRRLAIPVIPVLLFWTTFGWLALNLGLAWETLQLASQVALVPTWFLAAYVVIVTIAPLLLALWDRIGIWSIVAGFALAGLCDLLSIGVGVIPVGFLNYVFVWGTVHQLGYAWLDGKLDGMSKRIGLMLTGFLTTLAAGLGRPLPGGDGRARHRRGHQQLPAPGHPRLSRPVPGRTCAHHRRPAPQLAKPAPCLAVCGRGRISRS